jgi:hypothetical protein
MKKSGIILNLSSVLIIVFYFELVRVNNWDPQLLIYEIIPLIILIITYIKSIKNSGIWKLIHRPAKDIKESERRIYLLAINESYIYFSILISSVLILYTLLKIELNMVLIMAIVYLAHTLPALFLGWIKE